MNEPNFVIYGVLADVVWSALYLIDRLAAWWAIGLGLVAEYLILNRLLRLSRIRSAVVSISMNVLSSLVGWRLLIRIPRNSRARQTSEVVETSEVFANATARLFLGMRITWWGWYWAHATDQEFCGTFNSVTWAATCALAGFVSTLVEWPIALMATKKTLDPSGSCLHFCFRTSPVLGSRTSAWAFHGRTV